MKTLEEKIAVMQAALEGKKIEWFNGDSWLYTSKPNWDWSKIDYRVKQEEQQPEYVPYESAEEFLQAQKEHGMYLMANDNYKPFNGDREYLWYIMPIEIGPNSIIFYNSYPLATERTFLYNYLELINYTWADGTPCGKLKQ